MKEAISVTGKTEYAPAPFSADTMWITHPVPQENVMQIVRRFSCGGVSQARLVICGLGFFRAKINGAELDADYFKPLVTDYGLRDRSRNPALLVGGRTSVCVYEYEVAGFLQPGENVLEITLGNGYYHNVERPEEPFVSYGDKKAIFELQLCGAEPVRICSDLQADVRYLPIKSGLYGGDHMDFSAAPTRFVKAVQAPSPGGRWRSPQMPPDRVVQVLLPRKVWQDDGWVYDFGINHSGGVAFTVTGQPGQQIRLEFAEVLQEDGTLNMKTSRWEEYAGGRLLHRIDQTGSYILSGGADEIQPQFSWHCYRYVKISGIGDGKIENMRSLYIHTDIPRIGELTCSEPIFTEIHEKFCTTVYNNLHAGLLTDCPHREKRCYTGDGQIVAEALLYEMDGVCFYEKWLQDLCDAQTAEGFIPYTVPYISGGGGYAWSSAIAVVPEVLYRHTGNLAHVRLAYPAVQRWVAYCTAHATNHTCTVDANGAITVEGLLLYEMVIRNPFNVTPTGTTAEELGTTMSEASNIITAEWHAQGHLFGNVKLERYLSVVFYAKADNAWISFRDKLGEFNEYDTPIYANGVTDPETGVSEPDSLWHKYEFRRETDAEGKTSYRLYVDGKMHTHFDAENEVDARVKSKLTDFLLDLNGTYYVSELFGCLDPEYQSEGGGLEIYTQSPLVTPQDDYSTEDYPCEESLRVNVFNRPQWGKEQLISLPLAPYSEVKFYMNCPASGWIVGTLNGKDVATFAAGTGWHEFLIQKEGDKFALWVDGQSTGEYFGYNLNEMVLTLNDATYYVSELFVAADPNYVPVRYDQVTTKDPLGQSSAVVKGETPVDYITEMYQFTPDDWSNIYFKPLNALAYEQLRFFVRSAGKEDTWLQVALGADDLLATNDSEWHEVALIKVDGYATVYIDGVQKAKVTDLAQLRLVLTGGGTYYYTDIYGVQDADYVPVTLSGPSGEGYRIEFVGAYAVDNVATLEKGAAVSFRVLLSLDYDKSSYTVKVNGEKVTAEDGIYTITLTKNSTIKVEGVKENPNPYVMILENPFEIVGEATEDVIPEGFDHVTKLTTTWNRYSFVPVNLNKYTEVRFSVYSGGWFGLMDGDVVIDETTSNGQWLRIRLVRVAEGWQVWYNDKDEGILLLPYNNLSDLGFRFGDNVYYVTELKGLEDPNYSENPTNPEPDPDPDAPEDPYQQVLDHPFVLEGTVTDDVTVNGYCLTGITRIIRIISPSTSIIWWKVCGCSAPIMAR